MKNIISILVYDLINTIHLRVYSIIIHKFITTLSYKLYAKTCN